VTGLPLREDLRGIAAYGAPQAQDQARPVVTLNVNENPHAPSEALVAALGRAVTDACRGLNRYPDREAVQLRAALAAHLGHDLTAEQVWAANGSNEVLAQLLQAFGGPGRRALGFAPSYSMHEEIARTTNTGWIQVMRREDLSLDAELAVAAVREHHPDIVFVTSPNNPTGTSSALSVLQAVLEAAPGMVIVDEAYQEFARGPSALQLLPGHERLVVSRTMSKAFAFAGARLGYFAAAASVVDAGRLVRLPYHLSALTQAAALTALAHRSELLGTVEEVIAERDRLVRGVQALGLRTMPTDANFFLFGPFSSPPAAFAALLARGVLVRDVSAGAGLQGWLRVNAGTCADGDVFLSALAGVLASGEVRAA
jgi:histidinol-phosphate aminotransferase